MDNYTIELNVLEYLNPDHRCRSIVDLVNKAPVSAAAKVGKPLYSLLCSLRDTYDNATIIDSVSNENTLVSYFTAYPGSKDLRDQLDCVSALCSDIELELLTKVMLRLTKYVGIPGLAID